MGGETLFPPFILTQGHSNRPTPRLSPLILVQHRRKTRPTRSRTSPCPWPTSLLLSRGSQNSEAPQPQLDSRSGLHLPPRAIGEGAAGYEEQQLVPARCQVGAEERWRFGQRPSQEGSGRRTRL